MSELAAVVAVHSAITRAVRPRTVCSRVEAAAMVVSWPATTGLTWSGSIRATLVSCSVACSGVFTAPYTDSAVTRTGAIDRMAKNAMPALSSGNRLVTTCRATRRRIRPQCRAGIRRGVVASLGLELCAPVGAPPAGSRAVNGSAAERAPAASGFPRPSAMSSLQSVQCAGIGRYVDRVLLQPGERDHVERPLVRGSQHDRRVDTVLVRLTPAHRDHTPPITGLQASEPPLRYRRREVVADRPLVGEELLGHHSADGVQPDVLRTAGAGPVTVEAGHRIRTARLEFSAEDVAFRHGDQVATPGARVVDPVETAHWSPAGRAHHPHQPMTSRDWQDAAWEPGSCGGARRGA